MFVINQSKCLFKILKKQCLILNHVPNCYTFQNTSQATITYSLAGNAKALQYFQVDESSGIVSLKRSLLLDTDLDIRYFVSK